MTDPCIRAVTPMASEGWLLYSEGGLAAIDRPVLIIVGTPDEYHSEQVLISENLGTAEKFLISFVQKGHTMIFDPRIVNRMKHFIVAFFGHYLQGHEAFVEYFFEDFITQYHDLIWGGHSGE